MATPQPMRKTYKRPDLGIVRAAKELEQLAPEMELGWLILREHLHDAGWPTSTPEGDRKPSTRRMTVKCQCGVPFIDASEWSYHRDDTGHSEHAAIPPAEQAAIDYADPTGDLALRLDSLHRDLARLQDARHDLERAIKAINTITTKYRDGYHPATPLCSRGGCTDEVERRVSHTTAKVSYVGMEQIAGVWIAKAGVAPECAKHRSTSRREAA